MMTIQRRQTVVRTVAAALSSQYTFVHVNLNKDKSHPSVAVLCTDAPYVVTNGTDPDLVCMGNGCTVRPGPACLANVRLDSGNGGCTVVLPTVTGMVCCRNDYLVNSACGLPPPQVNLSIGAISPAQGQLLTNVTIPLNFEVNFDITLAPGAIPAPSWGSIIHFTATGNNYGVNGTGADLGDRIPGIWFRPGTWQVCSRVLSHERA
jgi:hypothetical protein